MMRTLRKTLIAGENGKQNMLCPRNGIDCLTLIERIFAGQIEYLFRSWSEPIDG